MADTPLTIPDRFSRLPLGAGPDGLLEQALGYSGQARFWATFWGAGDEACYADGNVEATGDWMGFRTFTEHPAVAGFLAQTHADLGSTEQRARHLLLIDRETRQVYLARFREGKQFLHAQWGPLPVLTHEELLARVQRIQAEFQAQMDGWNRQSPEEQHRVVMQRITEQQQAYEQLSTWLSQHQQERQ